MPAARNKRERNRATTRIQYRRGNHRFEILCDTSQLNSGCLSPEAAAGDPVVYRHRGIKHGDRASRDELLKAFGPADMEECFALVLRADREKAGPRQWIRAVIEQMYPATQYDRAEFEAALSNVQSYATEYTACQQRPRRSAGWDGESGELVIRTSLECVGRHSYESYVLLIKEQDRAVQGTGTGYKIETLKSQLKDVQMMQLKIGLVSRRMRAVVLESAWYLLWSGGSELPRCMQARPNIEYLSLKNVDGMSVDELNSAAEAASRSAVWHFEMDSVTWDNGLWREAARSRQVALESLIQACPLLSKLKIGQNGGVIQCASEYERTEDSVGRRLHKKEYLPWLESRNTTLDLIASVLPRIRNLDAVNVSPGIAQRPWENQEHTETSAGWAAIGGWLKTGPAAAGLRELNLGAITHSELEMMASVLAAGSVPSIEKLHLGGGSFNHTDDDGRWGSSKLRTSAAAALSDGFARTPRLSSLDLSKRGIDADALEVLSGGLRNLKHMRHLWLYNNPLFEDKELEYDTMAAAVSLGQALQQMPQLLTFDIFQCFSTGPTSIELLNTLPQGLQHLETGGENSLEGADEADMIIALEKFESLQSVNLMGGIPSSVLLAAYGKMVSLRSLELYSLNAPSYEDGYNISESKMLAKALRCLPLLETLEFPFNRHHFETVAPAMCHMKHLEVLAMESCGIDQVEMVHLAQALVHMHRMRHLDLRYNAIGSDAARLLVHALMPMQQLEYLDLAGQEICRSNRFTDDFEDALVAKGGKYCQIRGKSLFDEETLGILEPAIVRVQPFDLDLEFNAVERTSPALKRIAAVLEANPCFEQIVYP